MQTKVTPFHGGELAIQDKLGVKEAVASYAPQVIRPYMPEQHREFYEALPYFFMATEDDHGLPWASILWGEPGFIASPDPLTLSVTGFPRQSDPLHTALKKGQEVGMVGLQFHTRRRNRVNGRVSKISETGFLVSVTQSFGNCPQYIQSREIEARSQKNSEKRASEQRGSLSASDTRFVTKADTFFIASASGRLGKSPRHGVDMSHRGGQPGFVKVLEDGSLLFPDFSGNNHFNTLGNIHTNPLAGLLFIDFESGDTLQLSGSAEIIWPDNSPYEYPGAQRYVRITPQKIIRHFAAIPYIWSGADMSPYLPTQNGWTARLASPERKTDGLQALTLVGTIDDTPDTKSLYFRPKTAELSHYKPGQHLPIEVTIGSKLHRRNYTLSAAPGNATFRITVKRDPVGVVSNYFHSKLKAGDILFSRAPAGHFVLQNNPALPNVFLSAGIGITPMIAMAESLLASKRRGAIHFLHGARTQENTPFLADLHRWALEKKGFHLKLRFSNETKFQGAFDNSAGHLDPAWLSTQNLPKKAHYYICGPAGFMQPTYDWLLQHGVNDNHIHFESFGPSTVKRRAAKQALPKPDVPIVFSRSNKALIWNTGSETLLEAAEKAGIDAPFSCRSGSCGSCLAKLKQGTVAYEVPPVFEIRQNEVLLCCAVPNDDAAAPLVIDL